jgi:hypothetical protein
VFVGEKYARFWGRPAVKCTRTRITRQVWSHSKKCEIFEGLAKWTECQELRNHKLKPERGNSKRHVRKDIFAYIYKVYLKILDSLPLG